MRAQLCLHGPKLAELFFADGQHELVEQLAQVGLSYHALALAVHRTEHLTTNAQSVIHVGRVYAFKLQEYRTQCNTQWSSDWLFYLCEVLELLVTFLGEGFMALVGRQQRHRLDVVEPAEHTSS